MRLPPARQDKAIVGGCARGGGEVGHAVELLQLVAPPSVCTVAHDVFTRGGHLLVEHAPAGFAWSSRRDHDRMIVQVPDDSSALMDTYEYVEV